MVSETLVKREKYRRLFAGDMLHWLRERDGDWAQTLCGKLVKGGAVDKGLDVDCPKCRKARRKLNAPCSDLQFNVGSVRWGKIMLQQIASRSMARRRGRRDV